MTSQRSPAPRPGAVASDAPGQATGNRHRRRRSLLALVVVVLLVCGGVACGVPVDDEAQAIDLADLPEGLRPGFTPSTSTTAPEPLTTTHTVYLLNNPQDTERTVVVPAERQVRSPGALADVLGTLFGEATTADEQAVGYFNTLELFEVNQVSVDRSAGEATVDIVSLSAEELPPADTLRLVAAQLVFTVNEWGLDGTRILLDGVEVSIPTSDDDAEPGAVLNVGSYEQFQPQPAAPAVQAS